MTTVYLDPAGTAVVDAPTGTPAAGALLPGAVEALERLCEARYEVVVLANAPLPGLARLGGQVTYDPDPLGEVAAEPAGPTRVNGDRPWLIAADTGWAQRARPPGVRTIRVGPRRPAGRRTGSRFDLEARDLPAAVMEILVRDTMS